MNSSKDGRRRLHMLLPALRDSDRSIVFRWGVLCIGAGLALVPMVGDGTVIAAGRHHVSAPTPTPLLGPLSVRAIELERDPFVALATALSANATVAAVVLGPAPQALLQVGSRTFVVGVGDRVDGTRVVAIDASGIRLGDGTVLELRKTP